MKQVVLFDGPAEDARREKAQEAIKSAIKKGNYEWQAVALDTKRGKILEK